MVATKKRKRGADARDERKKPANGAEGHIGAMMQSSTNPTPECPFTIEYPALHKPSKRRRKQRGYGDAEDENGTVEASPFEPSLDIAYIVRPRGEWDGMRKYRNFVVSGEHFGAGDYVLVNHNGVEHGASEEPDFWVAHVLEVRAVDQQHVYVRVFWCYWPTELPGGRDYYHGSDELVPSNHMDVIDAMTVAGRANVAHWLEKDTDEHFEALYWRQTFRFDTQKLSMLREHCSCGKFYNPDKVLIGCSNPECGRWLHDECILKDALAKAYRRVAPASPHVNGKSGKPGRKKSKAVSSPWEGRLEARIEEHSESGTPKIVITDLESKDVPEETVTAGSSGAGKAPATAEETLVAKAAVAEERTLPSEMTDTPKDATNGDGTEKAKVTFEEKATEEVDAQEADKKSDEPLGEEGKVTLADQAEEPSPEEKAEADTQEETTEVKAQKTALASQSEEDEPAESTRLAKKKGTWEDDIICLCCHEKIV
ncbi:MAG: hypothetical protein M1832_001796 [Thelocarpon impressellum]|nr:MAG: hypothetical protein M1832_001796 [Thelocarpon impressellum]